MTTVETVLCSAVSILYIWNIIRIGKVKAERELMSNRINALADESKRRMDFIKSDISYIAKNAQGIASNALSSAQRAEAKIAKLTEVTTIKTIDA